VSPETASGSSPSTGQTVSKGYRSNACLVARMGDDIETCSRCGAITHFEVDRHGQRLIGCVECNRWVGLGATTCLWNCRRRIFVHFRSLGSSAGR
jgi:hypothetical protein